MPKLSLLPLLFALLLLSAAAQASTDTDEAPRVVAMLEPVSYTHLTLPTNREV